MKIDWKWAAIVAVIVGAIWLIATVLEGPVDSAASAVGRYAFTLIPEGETTSSSGVMVDSQTGDGWLLWDCGTSEADAYACFLPITYEETSSAVPSSVNKEIR